MIRCLPYNRDNWGAYMHVEKISALDTAACIQILRYRMSLGYPNSICNMNSKNK